MFMKYHSLKVAYDEKEKHYTIQVEVSYDGRREIHIVTEENYIDAKAAIELIIANMQPDPVLC